MLYNRVKRNAVGLVPIAGDTVISARTFANKVAKIDAAAGCLITLPVPAGTGDQYTFEVGTTVTSNSILIKAPNAAVVFDGFAVQLADAGAGINGWETAVNTDTVTLNGTTTGGLKGDLITFTDIGTDRYQVDLLGAATGTEATPFSATV